MPRRWPAQCPSSTNAREFGYVVEIGLSPADALRTATVRAAELLGQSDRLGRLEAGYAANLIAVDGGLLEE